MNLCILTAFQACADRPRAIEDGLGARMAGRDSGQRARLPAGATFPLSFDRQRPVISADIVDKVFDPFFTTKDKTGTDLGLPWSTGIVKATRRDPPASWQGGAHAVDTSPAAHGDQAQPSATGVAAPGRERVLSSSESGQWRGGGGGGGGTHGPRLGGRATP
jgi:hypothetical protein